ncbi:MAG TPA: ribbon-helix-helix domain-containing protein [Candidatus Limnocylindria bacterium]|nr:ribbon-helix-helix domain-containing protein [Candidatus Limnocylindria bacterium]
MGATRTQIYLTAEQRRKLDARRKREGKTLAAAIREAVDAYLDGPDAETTKAILAATFGASPNFTVPPRSEWRRRERRIWARRG